MITKPKSKAKKRKAFDVFVSHSSRDKQRADAVVQSLESNGTRCWIAPRDIIPGHDYAESIVHGIENSQLMVLVFSQHANESPQIIREVERAVHHRMQIIPFRIEDSPPSKSLEYFISSPHWLDAYSGSFDDHLAYLHQTVRLHLGETGSMPKRRDDTRSQGERIQLTTPFHFKERLKNRWAILPVLALAVATLVHFWPSSSPIVDARIVGKWQTTLPGTRVVALPEILSDGSYRSLLALQESGTVEIRRGNVFLKPKNGIERSILWMPIDASTAQGSPTPQEFWSLSSRFGNPASSQTGRGEAAFSNNPALVWNIVAEPEANGIRRWTSEAQLAGQPWVLTFETGPGSAYRFRALFNDWGTIRAGQGKWSATTALNDLKSGEYQEIDENTVALTSATEKTIWKRRAAGGS